MTNHGQFGRYHGIVGAAICAPAKWSCGDGGHISHLESDAADKHEATHQWCPGPVWLGSEVIAMYIYAPPQTSRDSLRDIFEEAEAFVTGARQDVLLVGGDVNVEGSMAAATVRTSGGRAPTGSRCPGRQRDLCIGGRGWGLRWSKVRAGGELPGGEAGAHKSATRASTMCSHGAQSPSTLSVCGRRITRLP